jgi:F0F1-type ATP synthase assembly protein I
MRQAAPYLAASWAVTAALLLGGAAGWWLDGKLGTKPWLLLAGLLAGVAIGMYQLGRVVLGSGRQDGP